MDLEALYRHFGKTNKNPTHAQITGKIEYHMKHLDSQQ